jgi:glycerophosphoryl diester phosphodiesterase
MEIITHRGLTSVAPENTLPAFAAALNRGFGIEVDLHTNADSEFVVSHDSNLERLTGVDEEISDLTMTEIKRMQISPDEDERTWQIPTLEETLDTFATNSYPGTSLALHLKGSGWDERVAELIDSLSKYNDRTDINIFARTFVFDIKTSIAERITALHPDIRVGLSIGESGLFPNADYPTIYRYEDVRDLDCWDIVWADEWQGDLYGTEFVQRVRNDDRMIVCVSPELHAETDPSHPECDHPQDVWERLLDYDVDGICTDFPTTVHGWKA